LEHACTEDAQCIGTEQTCDIGGTDECACNDGFFAESGNCVTVLGAICGAADDCTGADQTCDSGGTDQCACPSGFVVNTGKCVACVNDDCTCPDGSEENCLVTFFWTISTDLPYTVNEVLLNTQDTRDGVAANLQEPICGGTALETGCTVTILIFTEGSTIINGQTTHTAGQEIEENIKNNVVDVEGFSIATEPFPGAALRSSSASTTNFFKCALGLGSGTGDDLGKCIAGEGDCDENDQCVTGLVCGTNNCGTDLDDLADCCYDPTDLIESTCDGSSPNMWTCCKDKLTGCTPGDGCTAAGCAAGAGDCDNDDECAGSLVCGRNSCSATFNNKLNTDKFFPSGQADCCISKSRALFYGIPSRSDLEENFQNDDEPF